MSSFYGEAMGADRPLPNVDDPLSGPFWSAARKGRLEFQRCAACGYVLWPAAGRCPECLSTDLAWTRVSGRGRLWSWALYEQALHPAFSDEVPYIVAGIELEEGPFLTTNVVDVIADKLVVGMPVQAVFQELTPEVNLVKFRPVQAGSEEVDDSL